MRKLIYAINLTLDGCCDHTKGIADEELHAFYTRLLRDVDTFVYGRKTYELMVPYWPEMARAGSGLTGATRDFAQAFVAVRKIVVFSRSLESAVDENTIIFRDDLAGEISKLKQENGKNILTGGVNIPSQLLLTGLIDEYLVVIQPVIAGEGRRLFEHTTARERLRLTESAILQSGAAVLRYTKAGQE